MFSATAEAVEHVKSLPGLRAVVLPGEGKSFCAGPDLSAFGSLANRGDGSDDGSGNPDALTTEGITTSASRWIGWCSVGLMVDRIILSVSTKPSGER